MHLKRRIDTLTPSQTLSTKPGKRWLSAISQTECNINQIFSLISPRLFEDGNKATEKIKEMFPDHPSVHNWPSCFSGITVIVNRKTPPHRDKGCRPEWYDMLVAAGNYTEAYLTLPDLSAQLLYTPGTAVAICGKVFRHQVSEWRGGERICYAHYLRNNVLNRFNIPVSTWVQYQRYIEFMSPAYVQRHRLLATEK